MFGVLNRFIARLDSDPPPHASNTAPTDSPYGFQVLRNNNAELPIEPWFDFIIGINGHVIDDPDPQLFAREVANCAGQSLSLSVWSAKGQRIHTQTVVVPPPPQSLGLALQLAPLDATQNIWHIISIPSPLSPASLAGLLPHSDYILGTPSGTLRGEAALGELVEDHLNRSLVLWVYNSEFDVVREVELIPRRGWGGEGALGAVLGFGALHRLPVGLGEEIQAPGEKMFEAERTASMEKDPTRGGGHFTAPAEAATSIPPKPPTFVNPNTAIPPMVSPSAATDETLASGTAAAHGRKSRVRVGVSPNRAFDDMFEEGAKNSQERDHVPNKKGTAFPPPPKLGGSVGASAVHPAGDSPGPSPTLAATEDVSNPGGAEAT